MAEYQIDGPSTGKSAIILGKPIGGGNFGIIYRVNGWSGIVAKIYKDEHKHLLPRYHAKVAAMLATPLKLSTFSHNRRHYVQIAWPIARVLDRRGEFCGFAMREVDLKDATNLENILQKSVRKKRQLPEFYGGRVLLAANLAALMAEVHTLGHYMVDLKPNNFHFYPRDWYVALLDMDGFSINGPNRLAPDGFTPGYSLQNVKAAHSRHRDWSRIYSHWRWSSFNF